MSEPSDLRRQSRAPHQGRAPRQGRASRTVFAVAAAACLAMATPAVAEEPTGDGGPLDALEGLIERFTDPGAMDELEEDADAAIEEFLAAIGPLIEGASSFIDGLPAYHAPEVLPNGDIIIRRRRDLDLEDGGVTDI